MEKRQEKRLSPERENKSSAYKSKTKPPQYMVVVKLDGTEPEESFEDKGVVYERTDHIHIDLDSIPDHVRDDLARATLEAAKKFYSHPENKVEYPKWLAAREAKGVSK
jgi:hypothetical protein